ncbi:hypothetical protein [Archangium sp.]|uniref:hypothetical protein n=1 Tax=Archangium sp. TaxID=1872627 RepID=UPI00286AE02A|nr:hypothetical protein [Archangium sp.]
MATERRSSPMTALRNLALSLERLAAREAASGVVRGAADGLRQELPELDGQLSALLRDALTVLGRLAHEAAEREQVDAGAAAHTLAASATQGMLEVLEREWQDGGMPLHAFVDRLNRLLDEVAEFARSRTDEVRSPGERAEALVEGVVRAAMRQLHEGMPALVEDGRSLAPLGEELASHVGRGLVTGIESKLHEDADALVGLLERAGRGLVRGLAAGIREELASSPVSTGEALGASLEKLAERTTAATLRGAGGALRGLGTSLRRPLLAIAGAGSALLAVTVLSVRWRHA